MKRWAIVVTCLILLVLCPMGLQAQTSGENVTMQAPGYQGEIWPVGWQINIVWQCYLTSAYPEARIYLSTDGGTHWGYIACVPMFDSNVYTWTVPDVESNNCYIVVGCCLPDHDCLASEVAISPLISIYKAPQPSFSTNWIPSSIPEGTGIDIPLDVFNPNSATIGFYFACSMMDPDGNVYDDAKDDAYCRVPGNLTTTVHRLFYMPTKVKPGVWQVRLSLRSVKGNDGLMKGPILWDTGWIGSYTVSVKEETWGAMKALFK